MNEFWRYMRLTFAYSFFLLAISSACWFFFPSYRTLLAGFVLGLVLSIFNGIILAIKTVKATEIALNHRKRGSGMGTMQRFLLAGFGGFVAFRFPETFHWVGLVVGLSSVTILSLIVALFDHLTKRSSLERGER